MKKCLAVLLAVLLLSGSCIAEWTLYAWQGDVAVFEENGMLGLVNRAGDVVLEAVYDEIYPSGFEGYITLEQNERRGLADQSGRIVLPCEYAYFEDFDAVRGWVVGSDYGTYIERLIDLNSGETLLQAENNDQQIFWNAHYVVLAQYSVLSTFDDTEPKKIYDAKLNFLFEIHDDVDLLEHSAYIKTGDHYEYAILNPDGSTLADDIYLCWELDDGTIVYEKKIPGDAGDPPADEEGMVCYVGLIDANGVRFERAGDAIHDAADEMGFYSLHTPDKEWIYVDSDGGQVIDQHYDFAYPFIDGAAVVKQQGGYFLIDTNGETIGDLQWRWPLEDDWDWNWLYGWTFDKMYKLQVFPVDVGNGYRLADRSGSFIDDVIWKEIYETFGDEEIFICRDFDGKEHLIGMDGREAVPGAWDEIMKSNIPGCAWAQEDGLWGLIDLFGREAEPGAYLSDARYLGIYYNVACLPDGENWVYYNSRGEAAAPGYTPDIW